MVTSARRVRVYLNEGDRAGHRPAHLAVMELLRAEGAAGAVCFRGLEGFGARGDLHVAHLVDVDARLPLVIEWVDVPERVDRILPALRALVRGALVTVDPTELVLETDEGVRPVPAGLSVAAAMTHVVEAVSPGALVSEVVRRMIASGRRALPVVHGGVPVGIITQSDLVARGGVALRVDLLASLAEPDRSAVLAAVAAVARTADDVMTPSPVTVSATAPLRDAAETMAARHLKRLPVVDAGGRLAGILSRVDVLRAAAGGAAAASEEPPAPTGLSAGAPLATVMRRDVPVVSPDAPLPEVFQAVVATRLHRALVLDAERHVLGVISDAELLERLAPPLRRGLFSALVNRLPFGHDEREAAERHATARAARDLMSPVPQAGADVPLRDAIGMVLPGAHKLLAVVDAQGRLAGVLDRADILRGLLRSAAEG